MRGPVRVAAAVVAAGALAGSFVFTLLWWLQPESYWFVLFASYIPYALPGYLVALVALAALAALAATTVRRGPPADPADQVAADSMEPPLGRWIVAAGVMAAAGAVFHAALLVPQYFGEHPEGAAELTILALNARRGGADPAAVMNRVDAERAQVVVLAEVTPQLHHELIAAGLSEALPHMQGEPGPGASGTVVYSTYPLSETAGVPLGHGSYRVRVAAPTPFWLVAVHLAQPLNDQGSGWRADWSALDQVVAGLDGSVVVAGDFNSTLEHRPMRKLLDAGFQDAARQSNAGWQPTYPSRWGLLAIDHILTRGAYAAVRTTTPSVPGTDHRALVARLAVR